MSLSVAASVEREDLLLQQLYEVTLSNELEFDNKLVQMLTLGREFFGLQVGILSKITGQDYVVAHASPPDAIEPGTKFDLRDTYCVLTFQDQVVKAWSPAGESEINAHPCYEQMGLESYIGTAVFVEGQRYGTINFTSLEARERPFTEREKTFVELLSHWIGSEVTRQQQAERQAALFSELQAVNEELEHFAYRTSHDLKAPIVRTRRLTELLLYDIEQGTACDVPAQLTKIIEQSTRLETLISNMLDLVRAQRADEVVRSVDLGELMVDVEDRLAALIEDNPCRLEVSVDGVGSLTLPPVRMIAILENLVSNAIKYRDPSKNDCYVKVFATRRDASLVVEVVDNGLGIPFDLQPQVFESFSRMHPGVSYGSGLGLGIVSEHVCRLKGSIRMTSEPGQGTTFCVDIPTTGHS